jgi:hypothetical protein
MLNVLDEFTHECLAIRSCTPKEALPLPRSVCVAFPSTISMMAVVRGIPRAPGKKDKMRLLKEENNPSFNALWDDHVTFRGSPRAATIPESNVLPRVAAGID